MELVISNCLVNIQPGVVNCIMGTNLSNEEIIRIKKNNNHKLDIGIVVQPPNEQIFYYNVKRHLSYIISGDKECNDNVCTKIIEALKMVGLDSKYLNRTFKSLSRSEVYKIALASSLIKNPKIIILDNPFINMDAKNKRKIIQILKTIKKRYKKTIVIISNDSDIALEVSDYLFLVYDNNVVYEENKYNFFDNDKLLSKYNISLPKIIEFEKIVYSKKGKNIGYRDSINDLIKDIFFYK